MAGGLTPEQRWALIDRWGSVESAIDEALNRSEEAQRLWESQYSTAWWSHKDAFWEVFWKLALPVLERGRKPPRQRPPEELETKAVEEAKELLAERATVEAEGGPMPPRLTLEAIGRSAGLGDGSTPDRVAADRATQIRDLIEVGWDPLRTHPDFSVSDGCVRLPRIAEAKRLLGRSGG